MASNASIEKPEETYQRPESVASSDGVIEKPESRQGVPNDNERQQANDEDLSRQKSAAPSEIEYPGMKERIIVFVAILLALFLMALVSYSSPFTMMLESRAQADHPSCLGSNDSRNSHPSDH